MRAGCPTGLARSHGHLEEDAYHLPEAGEGVSMYPTERLDSLVPKTGRNTRPHLSPFCSGNREDQLGPTGNFTAMAEGPCDLNIGAFVFLPALELPLWFRMWSTELISYLLVIFKT